MLVDREEFSDILARLKPALSSGGVVQELTHFWFDKKSASAYDGGFGIRLELETELECGLPGTALIGLLATSALKEATLEPTKGAVAVKLGRSNSKLASLEYERIIWPFPELPKKAEVTTLDDSFIEALRKTLFVKASPATRVEHHGVTVERRKKDLVLFATDTATMVAVTLKGAGTSATFEKIMLPRDFAEQLVAQTPEGVELYVLDDCIMAVAEGVTLYSNVLDMSAADDMGAVVAGQEKAHPNVVPLPAGLEGALSRAEILAGREEPAVSISMEGRVLRIQGDYGLGKLDEALDLDEEPDEASMRIRAGHLRRALAHADRISVGKGSLLLKGDAGFTYLVASL